MLDLCSGLTRWNALQAYATYSFTFDWVYGPDSFQSEVYDKSAKGTVLSTLQASPRRLHALFKAVHQTFKFVQYATARANNAVFPLAFRGGLM